jgi:hypothetical protein
MIMPEIVSSEWIRDQIMKITALCERIVTKQEEQDKRINKIEQKVDELHDKPGKRWESVVTAFLTTIIGLLIGAYFIIPKT